LETYVATDAELDSFEEHNTVDIYRAAMRLRQRLYAKSGAVAKQFDLHVSEMALLDTLGKYGPLTMGELAERSFSSAANASYTIQGLEQRGLVQRERSRESQRVVEVKLTARGKKLFQKTYVRTVRSVNALLEQNLNQAQRAMLLDLLNRILAVDADGV